MSRSGLLKLVTLPVLAAAVVLLVVTKVRDGGGPTPWNLFGAGLICFSIGCVCKLSWAMARFNAVRQLELQLRQQLGLR